VSKQQTSSQTKKTNLAVLFNGRKAKWLPLYRRLLARLNGVPGLEFFPTKNGIGIGHPNETKITMGIIRITQKGLEVGLGLAKTFTQSDRLRPSQRSPKWITHRVVIAKAGDLDEELLGWVKAARLQARTSRPRST
jgi:hypothetical protein